MAIPSNAGVALLSWADGGTPCPLCLVSRLAEAGFEPRDSPSSIDRASIGDHVAASLARQVPGWAPVVLLRNGQATGHVLLPFPNCPGCASTLESLRVERRLPSSVLLDPLTGIASCLERRNPGADPAALCCAVTGRVHLPLTAAPLYAEGAGPDMRAARMSHLGESVERYSAFHPVLSRLVRAPAIHVAGLAAPVRLFSGYDTRQLARTGYQRLRPGDEITWAEGRSLVTGEKAMTPAALIYLHAAWPPEARFTPMMSTGTACARSLARGRLKGMLEVIERFRMLTAWNRQLFGARLPLAVIPDSHTDLLGRLRQSRIDLVLRALSLPPAAPVVIAALSGPRFPWIALGSAAGLCIEDASAKAADEAAHAYQELSAWRGDMPRLCTLAAVAPAQHHMLLWANQRRSRLLIEMLSADRPVRLPRQNGLHVDAVRRELLALCPDALEVVLTPPDCRLCGLEVIKVVAPGLPTLSFGSAGAPARHLSAHGIPRFRQPHPFG